MTHHAGGVRIVVAARYGGRIGGRFVPLDGHQRLAQRVFQHLIHAGRRDDLEALADRVRAAGVAEVGVVSA